MSKRLRTLAAGFIALQASLIMPFGDGGYTIQPPTGEPPTLVMPFGNGYTIQPPGGVPGYLMPFGNGYLYQPPPEPGRIMPPDMPDPYAPLLPY